MSRLSRVPLPVPAGVAVSLGADGTVAIKGKLGELSLAGDGNVEVKLADDSVGVRRVRNTKHARCVEGTYVRRLQNMIIGVSEGFAITLELHGTGYRASTQGDRIGLELGYSHPVSYQLPAGVTAETPAPNRIVVSGIDKVLVGQVAAELRAKRPPEPYKGKGVRRAGEHLISKEAKKK